MAETALNEAGQYGRHAVPLAAKPPVPGTPAVPQPSWTVSATRPNPVAAVRHVPWPPLADGTGPEAHLARAWLNALTVSGDELSGEHGVIPMDLASARRFLTEQSAALVSVLLGSPFMPRHAATVGHALVRADFTGADVLGRSLRVLIVRLPGLLSAWAPLPGGHSELEDRVAAVTEALANGYVRALRDRTLAEQESIRRAELDAHRIISEQLRHQAMHDPLTGLPNRAVALGRLSAAIRAADNRRIGLCYLDLDGFKGINDRYGHDAGDELLVTVAERIGRVASAYGALAARLGGDEFIVLAECSPGITGMIALTMDILAEVSHPVALRIGRVSVSACAGIVDRAGGSRAAETMVADADAALYQAKSHGPGHWAAHDPGRQQAG
jgi:diguanylate cyclase